MRLRFQVYQMKNLIKVPVIDSQKHTVREIL